MFLLDQNISRVLHILKESGLYALVLKKIFHVAYKNTIWNQYKL